MKIDDTSLCIFDTETTGLEPAAGDRIVEIAAVRLDPGKEKRVFQSLIDPQREISPEAFRVNGITPLMLKGAPCMSEVIGDFLEFARGACLCSYNASFDIGFLNHELKLSGKGHFDQGPVIDVLLMAKKIMPRLERHALWFVAESLGIKGAQAHRALSDVELTQDVFFRLKEKISQNGIDEFEDYLCLFGLNSRFLEDINAGKVSRLQEAIDLGVPVRIKYISNADGSISEREVFPKEIKQERKRNYLIGYCNLRQQERTFRIDNILNLEAIKA